jgi:hypothetical protein
MPAGLVPFRAAAGGRWRVGCRLPCRPRRAKRQAGPEKGGGIDQVPPAVRATIERETRGGRIKEIERQTKNSRVVYEVELVQGDKEYEIHVALDGTLLKRKDD